MSILAEHGILAGLLADNSYWPAVSAKIGAPEFLGEDHGIIFDAIGEVIARGAKADIITVYHALPVEIQNRKHTVNIGGFLEDEFSDVALLEYLLWVERNTPTSGNILAYADMLLNEFKESKPKIDSGFNSVLDANKKYCQVDIARHIANGHTLKELAKSVAAATYLPLSSVLLIGMGVFSSIACRRFFIERQGGNGGIPCSLYVVAEQPSGTAKSWCMSTFQTPFFSAHELAVTVKRDKMAELKGRAKEDSDAAEELAILKAQPVPFMFATNATPEAVEMTLPTTGGFFSAVSSEQGLFNSLLGLSYSDGKKANNNDILLNGFDYGYVSSIRVGREGYNGHVGGGVVVFAQEGSVEKILSASGTSGLCQRFLMLAEQHNLGKRDHMNKPLISSELIRQYAELAYPIGEAAFSGKSDIISLKICRDGWRFIHEMQNGIEPHLADGGKYSHLALRAAASKSDMQVSKIAAILHLLDKNCIAYGDMDIKHIISAIGIFKDLLSAMASLCEDKGIMGSSAEFSAIISYLSKSHKPRTERDIINSLRDTKPFSEISGGKTAAIRAALYEMDRQGLIHCAITAQPGGKEYKIYSLSQ